MTARPLAPGDIYLYLHENGAVTLIPPDQRSRFVTLAEGIDAALHCHQAGGEVHVGSDDGGLATSARAEVARLGVRVVPVDLDPPHSWPDGTTALMSAAAFGRDRILDDLIARGADLHAVDGTGSTPLHHAAAAGNLYAIDALVRAGADVDRTSSADLTARDVAIAKHEPAAARRLEELGADATAGPRGEVWFSKKHHFMLYVWPALGLFWFVLVVLVLWPATLLNLAILAVVEAAFFRWFVGSTYLAGGAPRRLRGTTLVIRRITAREEEIDLSATVLAGAGGATHDSAKFGGRWIILAHPAGHPIRRASDVRRLRVSSDDDVAALVAAGSPLLVVHVDGTRRNEVLLPLGNLLASQETPMLPSLRVQVDRARAAAADAARGQRSSTD